MSEQQFLSVRITCARFSMASSQEYCDVELKHII